MEDNYDVIIIGSGAAGLTTAIKAASEGLRTLVLESSDKFGGTTAVSGGRVWVPVNGTPENQGDTPASAKEYLRLVYGPDRERFIDTYVDNGPRMMSFIEEHTPHRWKVCPNYPDYHQEFKGATVGGRCLDMEILWIEGLDEQATNVRYAPSFSPITHAEWETWRYPWRFDTELLSERFEKGGRTGGNALAMALMQGALRQGVELRAETSVTSVIERDGVVVGVCVNEQDRELELYGEAVVIAAGGFDNDSQLVSEYLPEGLSATAAAPTNTGLGVKVAEQLNLPLANMAEGWWMPMVQVPGETLDGKPYPRGLVRERGVPRSIIVNEGGERFINEAAPYNEFGRFMHVTDAGGDSPNKIAYLIFDEAFRKRYPIPGMSAEGDLAAHLIRSDSIGGLAQKLNIETQKLENTVARWNELSANDRDEDFHRGDNAYDQYYGDPWADGNKTMGPIDQAPYYAVQILSGSVGTKGGLITQPDGSVIKNDDGETVKGLYAVGNSASHWTRDGYPGPGATLGLGMIFGMVLGEKLAISVER